MTTPFHPFVDDDVIQSQLYSADDYFAQLPFAGAAPQSARAASGFVRALGLFVVRESDRWDLDQFAAMADQTYQNARHIPVVEAVRSLGLRPFNESVIDVEVVGGDGVVSVERIFVEDVGQSEVTARVFCLGGYWHVWARTSAHTEYLSDDNDYVNPFTSILMSTVVRVKPQVLYSATPSRLTRSVSQGQKLLSVLPRNVDTVCIKDQLFDLGGEKGPLSLMFLNLLFWAAAQERDAIVTRFATGRIAMWRAKRWCFGTSVVPFGHQVVGGELVPDVSKRALVRDMMVVLASDMPDGEKRTQLAELGVSNSAYRGGPTGSNPVSVHRNASSLVSSLFAWAPLWLQGEYLWRSGGNYPKSGELSGVPIVRRDKDDSGELQMLYQIPLIEGGWAEPEVLRAFAEAAKARAANLRAGLTPPRPVHRSVANVSRDAELLAAIVPASYVSGGDPEARSARMGSRAKRVISAFAGWSWTDERFRYEVGVEGGGYVVCRRDVAVAGGTAGPEVARFEKSRMVDGLVPALVRALREGVPADVVPGFSTFSTRAHQQHVDVRAAEVKVWTRRRDDARKRAAAAHDLSLHPDIGTEQRLVYARDEEQHRGRFAAAEVELARLENVSAKVELDARAFEVMTDVWLPALRTLQEGRRITQTQYQALRTVLTDFRLERVDGIWTGSVCVRVNTSVGVATLGPVRWRIGHGGGSGSQEVMANHVEARHVSPQERRLVKRQLLKDAHVSEEAARVLLAAPFAELPHVVLAGVNGTEFPDWVGPQWREPSFVSWVSSVYTDAKFDWGVQYAEVSPERQACLDVVLRHGRVAGSAFRAEVEFLSDFYASSLARQRATSVARPRFPVVALAEAAPRFARRVFEPLRCPEGHPAGIVTRVPELLSDLLCECGRAAGDVEAAGQPDVIYPDEYKLLRVPAREALAVSRDRKMQSIRLGEQQQAMVCELTERGPATLRDLHDLLVRRGVRRAEQQVGGLHEGMRNLERLGLVEHAGSQPRTWSVTHAGVLNAEAHAGARG